MDALLKDVVEQLKKAITFLEKLKGDKKQKAERDVIVSNLNQTLQQCEKNLRGENAEEETYNDVAVEANNDVYNDVQSDYYDDVGRKQTDGTDAIYDDTEASYDDLPSQPGITKTQAEIPHIECEKLKKPSFADFMDVKKDAVLKNFLKSPWQKRWCVLHQGILYLYENAKDKKQKEAFRIAGYQFLHRDDISKEGKRKERCFELKKEEKVYEFRASDKEALSKWQALLGGMRKSISVSKSMSGSLEETYDDVAGSQENADSFKKKKGLLPGFGKKKPAKSPSKSPEIENAYDDNENAEELYEETGEGNYDDTGKNYDDTGLIFPAPIEPDVDDVYEETEATPTHREQLPLPPRPNGMHGRRASAKDDLPPIPSSPKPAGFPVPTTLPNRGESGSASGTIMRLRPPMPVPGDAASNKRELPPPPMDAPARAPSPGLPPPIFEEPVEKFSDGHDSLEGFGEYQEDYVNMYQGMWDCYPKESNELKFKRGEIIHIVSREYDEYGWWVAESQEEDVGLVPVSYLMKAYDI